MVTQHVSCRPKPQKPTSPSFEHRATYKATAPIIIATSGTWKLVSQCQPSCCLCNPHRWLLLLSCTKCNLLPCRLLTLSAMSSPQDASSRSARQALSRFQELESQVRFPSRRTRPVHQTPNSRKEHSTFQGKIYRNIAKRVLAAIAASESVLEHLAYIDVIDVSDLASCELLRRSGRHLGRKWRRAVAIRATPCGAALACWRLRASALRAALKCALACTGQQRARQLRLLVVHARCLPRRCGCRLAVWRATNWLARYTSTSEAATPSA